MAFSRGKILVQMALVRNKEDCDENNNTIPSTSRGTNVSSHDLISEISDTDTGVSNQTIDNSSRGNCSASLIPDGSDSSDAEKRQQDEEAFFNFDDTLHDPDYIPPAEQNHSSSDENESNIDHEEIVETVPTSITKRKSGTSSWIKNVAKRQRMEGKPYKGLKKNVDGKWRYDSDKPARILSPRQCSKRCERSGVKKCPKITEDDRKKIFTTFWNNMNWEERRVYVNSLIASEEATEKTVENSRRQRSLKYFLRVGEERLCVCKNLFLSTLGIGEKTVYGWLDNATYGIPQKQKQSDERKRAQVQRHAELREGVRTFLESLPKMESHYCRSSSTKLYLEPLFHSFHELYSEYKLKSVGNAIASKRLFSDIFSEMNLSLFSPKKDQCDVCCGYEVGNVPEEVYNAHQSRKSAAREEKQRDKELSLTDDSIRVITIDLQSVLLTPKLNASALYYKTKLACHNFTIFDLKSKDVKCYFWHEGQGDLSADSFASCIADYIEILIGNDARIKHVIIFSDGCGYQNRNVILSNTLCHTAKKFDIEISQKILEKGHTQMEVDSVHSVIERKLKRKNIYVPQNYVETIATARPSQPYVVHYIDHTFFKKYSDLTYYTSIRPGSKTGDPVVNDLRVMHYCPNGDVKYKLAFHEQLQDLPRRARKSDLTALNPEPTLLHDGPLKIKQSKFHHLQQLKSVIPSDYHPFYDNLIHGV